MRYKFYREHKYVSFALNDLERRIAKTDFRIQSDVEEIQRELDSIVEMLKGHATYENERLHELLRKKGSEIYSQVQDDHEHYDGLLTEIQLALSRVLETQGEDRVELGYQFYLLYRKFVGENLLHLHEEETVILPELQRLYTDEEMRKIEFETYHQLTPTEMIQMMEVLFPHMNTDDKRAILSDIEIAEPEKFKEVWVGIQSLLIHG